MNESCEEHLMENVWLPLMVAFHKWQERGSFGDLSTMLDVCVNSAQSCDEINVQKR